MLDEVCTSWLPTPSSLRLDYPYHGVAYGKIWNRCSISVHSTLAHVTKNTARTVQVSHILALAMGGYPDPVTPADHDSGHTESLLANLEQVAEGVATVPEKKCRSDDTLSTRSNSGRKLAEFVVVRHGFIFHQPHQPSTGWEATYGEQKDELRLYQVTAGRGT